MISSGNSEVKCHACLYRIVLYVPCSTSYCVYISQLIPFARVSSHVGAFNTRNNVLTQNFSDKDLDIINFVRRFQSFIGGILA